MSENLLEVRDLRVSFYTPAGEVKAVDGISYDLKENEVTESSEIPSFTLGLKTDYADFDLKKFDEDYKDGMKAFEMGK